MTIAKKIFIAVFLSTLAVGSILIWSAYKYTISRSEEDFVSRYKVLSRVLADTLTRLDVSTEALMLNAAKVVSEKMKNTVCYRQMNCALSKVNLGLLTFLLPIKMANLCARRTTTLWAFRICFHFAIITEN